MIMFCLVISKGLIKAHEIHAEEGVVKVLAKIEPCQPFPSNHQ
jgi:hypothetical protein